MMTKRAINISLLLWSGALVYALVIDQSWQFWVLAVVIGFVLGGIQACSRALLAQFTPRENSAEFFGFFSTGGKFAAIFGPALFGTKNSGHDNDRLDAIVVDQKGNKELHQFPKLTDLA